MKRKTTATGSLSSCLRQRLLIVCLLAVTGWLLGCRKDLRPAEGNEAAAEMMPLGKKNTTVLTVRAGESIQAAVNLATAGTVIKIQPGLYRENIIVDKPNITLMGEGCVTLQNPGNVHTGIVVRDYSNGFALKNITVRGFKERGVNMNRIEGFLLSHVTMINNGEFGILAEFCSNGTISNQLKQKL